MMWLDSAFVVAYADQIEAHFSVFAVPDVFEVHAMRFV